VDADHIAATGELTTERVNDASLEIDRLDAIDLVRLMNAEDARVAGAVQAVLPAIAEAVEGIACRLQQGGRLIYVGAGTSGRLGVLDAAECPPTFSTPADMVIGIIAGGNEALTRAVEEIEDRQESGQQDLKAVSVGPDDTVVGIAASGRTPYVLGALRYARSCGAFTVAVTCNAGSPLAAAAEVAIEPIVGPEVIAGSTRLKAGTATKMVLNMLSTGAMVLLGKTYGNLMVDLRPTNAKLRARTMRIVQRITGLDADEAAHLLSLAGGETKTAMVAGLAAIPVEEARRRLHASGGSVREAIEMGGRDDAGR
jgi:N-acetylmuramic acid 6-phosphate etherase